MNKCYNFLIDPTSIRKQITYVKSTTAGSIDSVGINTGGSQYKVNDEIVFDDLNSSGYRAGLIVGDIIVKVDNKNIENSSDIFRIIDEGLRKTGDNIKLSVLRNSINMEISLKLEGQKSTWWKF